MVREDWESEPPQPRGVAGVAPETPKPPDEIVLKGPPRKFEPIKGRKPRVSIKRGVDETSEKFFGRELEKEDYAALVGAQPGVKMKVTQIPGDRITDEGILIEGDSKDYRFSRRISVKDGDLVMENRELYVKETGRGIGTKILHDQVEALSDAGFDRIETLAAGQKGGEENGYYTWPSLGYDGQVFGGFLKKAEEDLGLEKGELASNPSILNLFDTPGGREWWKENGVGMAMSFDLKDGSRSREVLDETVKRKGI